MCLPLAFNLLQLLLLEVLLLLFLLLLLAFAQVSVTAAGNHSLLQVTHTHIRCNAPQMQLRTNATISVRRLSVFDNLPALWQQ